MCTIIHNFHLEKASSIVFYVGEMCTQVGLQGDGAYVSE